jgi:hypothetical protein
MNTARNLMMVVIFASLAISACTSSSATDEPHLEKVHALLEQSEKNGYQEACRYLHRLDELTQYTLAVKMLRDENPLVVYLGGAFLVHQKRYDEAAPVMTALILNDKDESDLLNHMVFDWRLDADPATWPNMMSRVGRALIISMESYPLESRKRAEHFLVDMLHLEVNKPFNQEDAVTAVIRLKRGLKQGNS